MTLSDHQDDTGCDHENDDFDQWDDVYEVGEVLSEVNLHRECIVCGEIQTHVLTPDSEGGFYETLSRCLERADEGDLSLRFVETDGINAYAHIVITDDGEEQVVSDEPHYFFI